MSGLPGRSFRCKRNRYPSPCKRDRTRSSGFVFLLWTAAMLRARCSPLWISTICTAPPRQTLRWRPIRLRLVTIQDCTESGMARKINCKKHLTLSNIVKIPVFDFFSGCGGTSAGLQASGMDIALGLDIDPDAASTFRRNFPRAQFIQKNIATLSPSAISPFVDPYRNGPILFCGCAPAAPNTLKKLASAARPFKTPKAGLRLRPLPGLGMC
jgi:hypothetical protein